MLQARNQQPKVVDADVTPEEWIFLLIPVHPVTSPTQQLITVGNRPLRDFGAFSGPPEKG